MVGAWPLGVAREGPWEIVEEVTLTAARRGDDALELALLVATVNSRLVSDDSVRGRAG